MVLIIFLAVSISINIVYVFISSCKKEKLISEVQLCGLKDNTTTTPSTPIVITHEDQMSGASTWKNFRALAIPPSAVPPPFPPHQLQSPAFLHPNDEEHATSNDISSDGLYVLHSNSLQASTAPQSIGLITHQSESPPPQRLANCPPSARPYKTIILRPVRTHSLSPLPPLTTTTTTTTKARQSRCLLLTSTTSNNENHNSSSNRPRDHRELLSMWDPESCRRVSLPDRDDEFTFSLFSSTPASTINVEVFDMRSWYETGGSHLRCRDGGLDRDRVDAVVLRRRRRVGGGRGLPFCDEGSDSTLLPSATNSTDRLSDAPKPFDLVSDMTKESGSNSQEASLKGIRKRNLSSKS
ncbi:unnamed protein product [Hydatigera taeniaeformis]|uniref:Uncharacterized protein n=1 Tax=Hydatigena taeniaeformis TaxID=6205 RepID=A0A0R3WSL7_HYDTA|nr:unnamed protein product [Hydatigera taeniaeformis]